MTMIFQTVFFLQSFRAEETREKYSIKHFYSWWNKFLKEEPEVFQ